MKRDTFSDQALILTPRGRDAEIAAAILKEAGLAARPCTSLPDLIHELDIGAAYVVVTEEALATADLGPLAAWLADQEEWSDLPFVLLTSGGGGLERNPAAKRYLDVLGNVTFLERPFHPTTLVSLGGSAMRARRRQYEARARLEALRDSEARYRTLFEAIDSGFCVVEVDLGRPGERVDYRVIEANPAFYRQTGFSADVLGRWLREAAPALEEHWYETYGRIALTGQPERFEQGSAALDRWFDIYAFRVGVPDACRVAILFNDISARRHVENRLRELNGTLETEVAARTAERDLMWRTSPDLLLIIDFEGVVRRVSPAWTAILGFEEHELVGTRVDRLVHPDDVELTERALLDAAGGPLPMVENRYRHKDGSYRWISWITAPPEEDLIYATGRHVTAEKQRLTELEAAREQLRQAQKMEAVGQLTGGVAHDFNNLLTIIKSSTDLLRRPDLAEERRRRYVDAIADTVDRAAKLTGQLLAFARRQALKPEVFNVAGRIRAITEMLGTIVGSRIRIVTDVSEDACFVETDASQFETALVNLAVNARDAMDGEGTLTVKVHRSPQVPAIRSHRRRKGDFVCLTVSDTGTGIPADRLPRIFEPFFTTKEVGKGTGLGLSQVFGFTKQSGGDVAVQSRVGLGTTFSLYLPRVEAESEARDAERHAPTLHVGVVGRRRVLVVEDNVEVGTFSTQLLQDLGYETVWAANADEALRLIAEVNGFDVVFSDVVMPGMSGIELGHEIQRRRPGLPVVLASGYSHVLAEEGRHGFELLQKPYAVEDLSRVLRRVTRGQEAGDTSSLPA